MALSIEQQRAIALASARARAAQAQPQQSAYDEEKFAAGLNPTNDMTGSQLVRAGIGRGLTRAVHGIGQATGLVSDDAIAQSAQDDSALMGTTEGKVGDVVGTIGAFAPTALIPGANTYTGAAAIGGIGSALMTPGSAKDRAVAGAWGAAGGAGGKALGQGIGKVAKSSVAKAATSKAANAVKDATLQTALRAGYVVPPSQASGNMLNRTLESVAGKASTAQHAAIKNQDITNNLARQYIGLKGNGQISEADLDALKKPLMAVYGEMRKVSSTANDAVDLWKKANYEMGRQRRFFNRTLDPKAEDAMNAARADADTYLQVMEQEAISTGRRDLAKSLKEARVGLGKIGTVEDALNDATGNVSAAVLKRVGDRVRLGGELKQIADFAAAFPKAAREMGESVLPSSPLDLYAASAAAAVGHPGLLGTIAGRPVVRSAILSRPYQNAMGVPNRAPNKLAQLAIPAMENRVTQNALRVSGSSYGSQE